ncbi:unnamed protein product [Schistosoma margrebowiei]|uniref:Uncharacterized protein n=1 Tax=Schistosoma margrebowiei TaxID=48269 RepID=A0A3P7ZHT8_9TREM|nr:unnamed protein product [Schistosoma margrebowiei]
MPAELVQATSQESFKRQLDLFLRTKDSITLWFTNFFSSFVVNIPRFLPGGFGDPLLLDTEAC